MAAERRGEDLLRAQLFLEFLLDLTAVLAAVFAHERVGVEAFRQRAEVGADGRAHLRIFLFREMDRVNVLRAGLRADARLCGDLLEAAPDFLQIERHVLDHVLDVGEMFLLLRLGERDALLDRLQDDGAPFDVVLVRVLAPDAVDDVTAATLFADVLLAVGDERLLGRAVFFALDSATVVDGAALREERRRGGSEHGAVVRLPVLGQQDGAHAVNRELQRDVFLVEAVQDTFEAFHVRGVFCVRRAAGRERRREGALLLFELGAGLGEVAVYRADGLAVLRDVTLADGFERAGCLVIGALRLGAGGRARFCFLEQGRALAAQALFLLGAVERVGERFIDREAVSGRFALRALEFFCEAFLIALGLCELFLETAAVCLDAVDAAEEPASFVSENAVSLVRLLRRGLLDVIVVETLADGGGAAFLRAEGRQDVLELAGEVRGLLRGRIEARLCRLFVMAQRFLRFEMLAVLALQLLVDVELGEAVFERILLRLVVIAEFLVVADALLALFDRRFAVADGAREAFGFRLRFVTARLELLVFGKRVFLVKRDERGAQLFQVLARGALLLELIIAARGFGA